MTSSSSLPSKLGGVVVALAVLFWNNQDVRGVGTQFINASSRLVSGNNVGGEMCMLPVNAVLDGPITPAEDIPINPVTIALGMNVKALQPLAAAQGPGQGPARAPGQAPGQGRGAETFTLSPGAPLPSAPA